MSLKVKRAGRFTTFLLLPLLIAAAAFLGSKYFRISDIIVSGNNTIQQSDVIKLAGIVLDSSIFTLDEKQITERVESDPRLIVTNIERIFPNKVCIHIQERKPFIQLEYKGGFMIIDKNCILMSVSDNAQLNFPMVKGATPLSFKTGQVISIENDKQKPLAELLSEIDRFEFKKDLLSIDITDDKNIIINVIPEYEIIIGLPYKLDLKIKMAEEIIKDCNSNGVSGGIVDVRDAEKKQGYFSSPRASSTPGASLSPSANTTLEPETS